MVAERTCEVTGCTRKHVARGYCGSHYERWRRTGDPGPNQPVREYRSYSTPEEEVAARSSRHCPIEWDGRVDGGGFGLMQNNKGPHRLVWELANGEKLNGRQLVHLCGNRICLTPEHITLAGDQEPLRCKVPGCGQPRFDKHHCEQHWNDRREGITWVTRLATRTQTT